MKIIIFSIISIYSTLKFKRKQNIFSAFAVWIKHIKFIWKVVVERAAVIDHIMKITTHLSAPKL
jgi:hypothetical protein